MIVKLICKKITKASLYKLCYVIVHSYKVKKYYFEYIVLIVILCYSYEIKELSKVFVYNMLFNMDLSKMN